MREQMQAKGDHDPRQGEKSGKIGRGGAQRYLMHVRSGGLDLRVYFVALCAAFKLTKSFKFSGHCARATLNALSTPRFAALLRL